MIFQTLLPEVNAAAFKPDDVALRADCDGR